MPKRSVSKKLAGAVALGVLLVGGLALALLASPQEVRSAAPAMAGVEGADEGRTLLASSELTNHVYIPSVARDYGSRSFRVGYCAKPGRISEYPDIRDLKAGWYVDFGARSDPAQPLGMEHVQMVRLHQLTECWPERLRDRDVCPYVEPYTYTLTSPGSKATLRSRVKANPGALWLIGNEMDRYDWGVRDPDNPGEYLIPPGGQDEMLPRLYAQAYYELYHLIKNADPTAKVAIGGIIQATPARLEYLTKVWDEYVARYNPADEMMPVDVWNVHNFIFKERCDDYGADVPPGYDGCYGTIYEDEEHNDMEIFDQQIRAFRQWMEDHYQQGKPLIVSEYGILYHHIPELDDPAAVRDFMLSSFDYFMNTRDPALGYPADNYRLVQRWAWYPLDNSDPDWNDHAYLFDKDTLGMTALGEAFEDYTEEHLDVQGTEVPDYWP